MYKTRNILAVLLAFQLLLALALGLSGSSTAPQTAMPLVSFDRDGVDRIVLEGPEQTLTLARKGGSWVLPEQDDFPVPDDQVKKLLDRLADLQTRLPVASSEGARKRFRVDDEDFERRITLARGEDTLARVYLGKSPGMRMIYARADSQKDIHAVKMAAYDVPLETRDWEDKSLLTLPKQDIRNLELAGLEIVRAGDSDTDAGETPATRWQATGLKPREQLDQDAVDKLASQLAELRFDMVLGKEEKEEYGLSEPVLELSMQTGESGDSILYRLGKHSDQEVYTLKLSSRPEYFRLAPHTAKSLVDAAAYQQLVSADTPEAEMDTETENTQDAAPTDIPAS